jgi:hypothetical protein
MWIWQRGEGAGRFSSPVLQQKAEPFPGITQKPAPVSQKARGQSPKVHREELTREQAGRMLYQGLASHLCVQKVISEELVRTKPWGT